MSSSSSSSSSGIGFFGLLAVLFIGLKLTGFIAWNWWWVLSPLWGGLIIWVLVFIIFGALAIMFANISSSKFRKKIKNKR